MDGASVYSKTIISMMSNTVDDYNYNYKFCEDRK